MKVIAAYLLATYHARVLVEQLHESTHHRTDNQVEEEERAYVTCDTEYTSRTRGGLHHGAAKCTSKGLSKRRAKQV